MERELGTDSGTPNHIVRDLKRRLIMTSLSCWPEREDSQRCLRGRDFPYSTHATRACPL